MRDPMWDAVKAELKREDPVDPEAVARIMARLDAPRARPLHRRVWNWFVRPRQLQLSPAAGMLAAAALAALLVQIPRDQPRHGTIAPIAGTVPAGPSADTPEPVHFVITARGATRVSLVGDFNDWNPDKTPLAPTATPGVWSARVALRPGVYLYAFVVDDSTWVADTAAPRAPESAFGGPGSIVLVGGGI